MARKTAKRRLLSHPRVPMEPPGSLREQVNILASIRVELTC